MVDPSRPPLVLRTVKSGEVRIFLGPRVIVPLRVYGFESHVDI